MRLLIGLLLITLGSGGIVGELLNLRLPAASWFFDTSREAPLLSSFETPYFGWLSAGLAILVGLIMVVKSLRKRQQHPAEIRRRQRFNEVKRGVWSLRIVLLLVLLAGLDFVLVGNQPLVMKYGGEFYFPAFQREVFKGEQFGIEGELAEAPVNFRSLKRSMTEDSGDWLIMPLIPYAPTGDSLPPILSELTKSEEGLYQDKKTPYSGLAARVFDPAEGEEERNLHMRFRLRDGALNGPADGWDAKGDRVYGAQYTDEQELLDEDYFGGDPLKTFLKQTPDTLYVVQYHPAPPSKSHLLGTDSSGNDVLAYLFGGLQVNIQAALFYIPFVYLIGVTVGLLMGYFGGIFDLVMQRVIEALEAIPFLFVIIIITSVIPVAYKGLGVILLVLICFNWMGKTYLMRTAAYKEKARDYVASAKVLGASTPRILIKHILPNILSILVTVIPFAISGVISSITALDYLGFGLPPKYASWGKLLNDGLSNLSSPWLVSSGFVALVALLTLITFIGEAVREAWDPRRFTIYK